MLCCAVLSFVLWCCGGGLVVVLCCAVLSSIVWCCGDVEMVV